MLAKKELPEQDWRAAFDTLLMLGNVDLFYYPGLIYSDTSLYDYAVTKVRRRLYHIKSELDEHSKVNPVLDMMLETCTNFQATLYTARNPDPQSDEIELSESELSKLSTQFLNKMSGPITWLVETYELHPPNQYLTELMVRPA
ncbi:MAG TPA: hypothetical protein VMB52_05640 [Verrucomicrobiae bacterium]|nr:hypothetical protein [Verrucomicrobiae bacterium]